MEYLHPQTSDADRPRSGLSDTSTIDSNKKTRTYANRQTSCPTGSHGTLSRTNVVPGTSLAGRSRTTSHPGQRTPSPYSNEKRVQFEAGDNSMTSKVTNTGDSRRRTVPELQRHRSVKAKPRPKSMGFIFVERNGKPVQDSDLLRAAVREDVHQRRLLSKFRFLMRFHMLLHRWWKRHSPSEVTSNHPFYMQYQMIQDSHPALEADNNDSRVFHDFKVSYFRANKQMRMSQEARRIMSLRPSERTEQEVYYAMIALRGIDSIADYPLRMQKDLAAHGMFQSFGPKRIIVKQGHDPQYFYFILYGRVVVATTEGGSPYAKTRVTLGKGENFGAEELAIAHRSKRQSTVITMEVTEFLTIDCDTYENIFMAGGVKTIHDPDHHRFMRSLYFLKEWPIEKLESNPKQMQFCYFRRGTVMVKDSNVSDWIYIVKSGSLKVFKKLVKCYPTVNKKTGHQFERANRNGYFAFLNQEAEFHRYAMYNKLNLPKPLSLDDDSQLYIYLKSYEEKENLLALPLMQRLNKLIRPRTTTGGVITTYGHGSVKRPAYSAKNDTTKAKNVLGVSGKSRKYISETSSSTGEGRRDSKDGKRTLLDDYEGATRTTLLHQILGSDSDEDSLASDTDTEIDIVLKANLDVDLDMKEATAADRNPEFVLVQTLTKGHAFGLQQTFIENQPSLYLVSNGAECIMLNKKFYKEFVDPNVAQRLKAQISPYPSDDSLQENLRTRVNWMEYRKICMEKLMDCQEANKDKSSRGLNIHA